MNSSAGTFRRVVDSVSSPCEWICQPRSAYHSSIPRMERWSQPHTDPRIPATTMGDAAPSSTPMISSLGNMWVLITFQKGRLYTRFGPTTNISDLQPSIRGQSRSGNPHSRWNTHQSKSRQQCEIIEDSKSGTIKLKVQITHHDLLSEVFRESSRGYAVTDDRWVLSPSQKRLLWLPHSWRSGEWGRAWGGRFLGLLHDELSEVVVLECLE